MPKIERLSLSILVLCLLGAHASRAQDPIQERPQSDPDVTLGELVEVVIPIPARRGDEPSTRPSPDHVWVSGHWERSAGEWSWVRGEWKLPPFEDGTWVRGHWVREGARFRWAQGYWAVGQERQIVEERVPKPQAPSETKPPRPSDEAQWIPGRWEWADGWRWSLGSWATPPEPDAVWVEGDWQPVGEDRWRWMPSHWLRASSGLRR